METLKNLVRPIIKPVADLLGIRVLYAGIAMVAVALIIIFAIVIIIVEHKRHNKHKAELEASKAKAEKVNQSDLKEIQQANAEIEEKPVEVAPTVEAKEEKVAQPVETKVEEAPKVQPVAEPVEEVKEEKVEEVAPVETTVEEKAEEKVEEVEQPAPAPVVEEVKVEKPKKAKAEKTEEVAPAKEEVKAPAKKPATKKAPVKKSLPGKWIVELKSTGEFMSKLVASNGEVMLSSEIYSSEEGARTGIATIIKWVEEGDFIIYQDKKKNFYYKLKTSGNRLICVGEIYKSKDQCESAVESVKRIAKTAIISEDLVEGARYVDYRPIPFEEMTKGPQGKWRVETLEDGRFSARLYASNGQLMIATEEVATRKTALNAIESVKKNSVEGNFIVDRDKFGRYYYKLRNAQKSVICIGEAYDSLSSCTKALESVRRFAINSIVIPE